MSTTTRVTAAHDMARAARAAGPRAREPPRSLSSSGTHAQGLSGLGAVLGFCGFPVSPSLKAALKAALKACE